jgi:flavin reductase (DIM6/NTAB) family NADH-FMN oxidoreductase RutF
MEKAHRRRPAHARRKMVSDADFSFSALRATKCFANRECKVIDTRLVNKYDLFLLEVVQAWTTQPHDRVKTIHRQGYGRFVVDGKTITLKSKMR